MRALISVIAVVLLQCVYAKINGMAFTTGHDTYRYRTTEADESLQELKKTGCNYIHISAYARMDNLNSTWAAWETDDESIRVIVRKCKAMGFKVFLKPVIELDVWRGYLKGTPEWFNGVYEPYILHMAKLAQQEKVDLFAAGSEYRGAENKTEEWIKVIQSIRKVYKGKLTYVGNHDSYKGVKFWKKLDIISINAYWPLVKKEKYDEVYGPSPDMGQTLWLFNQKANELETWREQNGLTRKKVIVAEFGVQSKGEGVVYRVPYDWKVEAEVSRWEQVKMYEGFFNAFMRRPWCAGAFVWHWEHYSQAGMWPPSDSWYTPQNKPALEVMKRYFKEF